MQRTKRHHYTPRYYLKRFENEAGALWRLDCDTNKIVSGNNERFGYANHWNALRDPPAGYDADWAEKQIARIDGYAAGVIAQLVAGDLSADIRPLAMAISFMHQNQPRLMKELEKTHSDTVSKWDGNRRLFVRLKSAMDNWQHYVPLYHCVYQIAVESSERFLTSSNPLIEFSNKPTMLLPLSSRHCLFMSNDPDHERNQRRVDECDAELIEGINQMTKKNAWQYVYSRSPSFSD